MVLSAAVKTARAAARVAAAKATKILRAKERRDIKKSSRWLKKRNEVRVRTEAAKRGISVRKMKEMKSLKHLLNDQPPTGPGTYRLDVRARRSPRLKKSKSRYTKAQQVESKRLKRNRVARSNYQQSKATSPFILQEKEIVKYTGGGQVKRRTSHSLETNKQLPTLSQPGGFFLAIGSRKRGTDKAWAIVREGGKTSLKKFKGGKTTTYSGIRLKRPTANQSLGLGFGGVGAAGLAVQDWDKARDNLPSLFSTKKRRRPKSSYMIGPYLPPKIRIVEQDQEDER